MRLSAEVPMALLALLVQGCASAPMPTCKVPAAVELEIESSDRVNQDAQGRALPTRLRLYQLSDLSRMQSATFDDIWTRSADTLQATAVAPPVELTVYPGQIMVERFDREDKADYLVGVAVFRKTMGTSWRTLNEWPLPGDPCAEREDPDFAPKRAQLRVRMFLGNYRVDSTNDYHTVFPRRSCPAAGPDCAPLDAPDELPEALHNRHLRTFDEDPSPPSPTAAPQPTGDSP